MSLTGGITGSNAPPPELLPPSSRVRRPRWTGVVLIVAGLLVLVAETDNPLGLLGLLFVGIGGYTLLRQPVAGRVRLTPVGE